MSVRHDRLRAPKRRPLTAALLATIALSATLPVFAQDAAKDDAKPASDEKAKTLDKVVVTGSLIPQTELETFTPVTVISAEDIKVRGYTDVADALQKSTMATGGVQGAQFSAGFTQGAETLSLFGLSPGYVKYLIDGRPMSTYPALYNGNDAFNNISGIPIDLVDRIEILPGGQSSLYGSDAIAGVINIILKKKMDGGAISIRGGTYSEGGGSSFRVSLADGFSAADGRLNVLAGIQYQKRNPIWGYQRDLTKQYNTKGTSAPLASRDYLVYSPFTSYHFLDPNNCENVKSQFGGTEGLQQRPGFGDEFYCGSFYTPGYATIMNGKESTQVYTHGTFDINDNVQLYGDVLYSHEKVKYHVGSGYTWWGTGVQWGYYYDPDLDDFLNLQRAFAPEEFGPLGYKSQMSVDTSKAYQATLGARGTFGASNWDYDAFYSRTEYKLNSNSWVRFSDKINQYFIDHVLGPQQGLDPYYGAYPVFTPDYAAFYTTMSPEDLASFTGRAASNGKTSDDLVRAQVVNGSLFSLPGGDAGLAIAAEYGREKWNYVPDPGYVNGDIWGQVDVAIGGKRDRYSLTTELKLPVLDPLTVTFSGRYDSFTANGRTIDKPTYSLGLEYRPVESLLLRGKYGTAFRAPTLSDLNQGLSGSYVFVTDYYSCGQLGFDPGDTTGCPNRFSNVQIVNNTSGNKDLQPINADVWSVGAVWAPTSRLSFTVDYHNWDIKDEVAEQSANSVLLQEYRCRNGLDDINSALCTYTLGQITRGASGNILSIYTPKVNIAQQKLEVVTAEANYGFDAGTVGDFLLRASWTTKLKHEYLRFEGDTPFDLLNDPVNSTDPKHKGDASLTWRKGVLSATLYANWMDSTPNYRASISGYYDPRYPTAGKLGSYTTYNLSTTYQPMDNLSFSLLINNLANKMPPFDATYPGNTGQPYNIFNYNVYGRAVYLEMRYGFGK